MFRVFCTIGKTIPFRLGQESLFLDYRIFERSSPLLFVTSVEPLCEKGILPLVLNQLLCFVVCGWGSLRKYFKTDGSFSSS